MYVVLTPLLALLLFRVHAARAAWVGVAARDGGPRAALGRRARRLGRSATCSCSPARPCTRCRSSCWSGSRRSTTRSRSRSSRWSRPSSGLLVVAISAGQLRWPHGWTVWGALLVTGVFASALAFLAQTWAQRRATATQTALAFSLEPVWAAFFGVTLAGDRLGGLAWLGCAVIMAGIVVAEPAAGARAQADRAEAAPRMTAVLLALASAALFGGDDDRGSRRPARRRRRGRRGARDRAPGARRRARRGGVPPRRASRLAVLPRRAARPRRLADPVHARGARDRRLAHVGHGRRRAARRRRDRARLPRRAAARPARDRRARGRRGWRAARRRA